MGQQGETHTLQGRRLDEIGLMEPSLRGPAHSKCSIYGHVFDFSSTKLTQATLPAGKLHSKLQRVWSMGVGPEYILRFRFCGLEIQMCLNRWKKGWNSFKWTPLNLGLPSSSWKTDGHFFFFFLNQDEQQKPPSLMNVSFAQIWLNRQILARFRRQELCVLSPQTAPQNPEHFQPLETP